MTLIFCSFFFFFFSLLCSNYSTFELVVRDCGSIHSRRGRLYDVAHMALHKYKY